MFNVSSGTLNSNNIKRQFVKGPNMALVTTRVPNNVG